jgi:hypothetical protein
MIVTPPSLLGSVGQRLMKIRPKILSFLVALLLVGVAVGQPMMPQCDPARRSGPDLELEYTW